MRTALIAAGVLALSIGPALAATNGWNNSSQWNGAAPSEPFARHASNINQSDVRSDIAPTLPKPSVGPDAGPAVTSARPSMRFSAIRPGSPKTPSRWPRRAC